MGETQPVNDLLARFLEYLARIGDCEVIFTAGADREDRRREAAICKDDSWVPSDEDGAPVLDYGEFLDHQSERVVAMRENIGTSHSLLIRLLCVGLHHSVEVFMRCVAIEAAREFGAKPPKPKRNDDFNPSKWFKRFGVDLTTLPHSARLLRIRDRVGLWKHTGFSDQEGIKWFIRENFTPAAFLDLDRLDEESVEELVTAAGEFAKALVAAVNDLPRIPAISP